MYETLSLYVDGQFLSGGGRKEQDVTNPADGSVIGKLPHATREDLDRALAAAERTFNDWKRVSPLERCAIIRKASDLLRQRAKEIALNITLVQG